MAERRRLGDTAQGFVVGDVPQRVGVCRRLPPVSDSTKGVKEECSTSWILARFFSSSCFL